VWCPRTSNDVGDKLKEFSGTLGEEIANSASHGLGAVLALIGAPFVVVGSSRGGDALTIAGSIIFAASVFLLYLASTLYHALPPNRAKRVFRVIDHSAIFLLIAGTYTPFTLGVLRGPWGWTLFTVVWILAALGVIAKAVGGIRFPRLSTTLYIVMGWLVLVAIRPLWHLVPIAGWMWLFAGGVAYTAGVVFFATDSRVRYGHFVWHLFVLGGTVCHYFAVLWYAIPVRAPLA
jgi:hemolysin III